MTAMRIVIIKPHELDLTSVVFVNNERGCDDGFDTDMVLFTPVALID